MLTPSADSHIESEVWLPDMDWNGKFEEVGNGGFNGNIVYPAMAAALQEGYATASTDGGHKGGSASFALGHPEKIVDFGYRGIHETALKAKSLIGAYYGRSPRLSYWNGCSTGGRQGLKEAQRFPEDFDGIVAGAPANYETHLHAWTVAVGMAAIKGDQNILPASLMPVIHRAVLASCDSADGLHDGLLNDPRKCAFDPSTLLCRGAANENCLTADQVEAVKKLYAPLKTKAGELIFPSFEPGSELGWPIMVSAKAPNAIGQDTFRYLTYGDPDWDWHTFDPDRDTAAADQKDNGIINAIDALQAQSPRRQAAHVPRLERSAHRSREQHQLLFKRPPQDGLEAGGLVPPIHGAGHATLRRRSRRQPGQLDGGTRALA